MAHNPVAMQTEDDMPILVADEAEAELPLPRRVATVDLGSNSFRLLVAEIEHRSTGLLIRPLDGRKEQVRLAAGLGQGNTLDAAAFRRGIAALERFGEHLRAMRPDAVRVVATSTLRVAANADAFVAAGAIALGFPIQVIAGAEEARLIYLGAAHRLPVDGLTRLVVDIGGGSTECIVGRDREIISLDSLPVGCVTLSTRYFADGSADRQRVAAARAEARALLADRARHWRGHDWTYAVGTSGTARALVDFALHEGDTKLRREHLERLAGLLASAGHVDRLEIPCLRADRRPVIAGGLAAMLAVFDEFGIESMRYCDGALREGALHDLLARDRSSARTRPHAA